MRVIAFAVAFMIVFAGAWSVVVGLLAGPSLSPVMVGAVLLLIGFGSLRSMSGAASRT